MTSCCLRYGLYSGDAPPEHAVLRFRHVRHAEPILLLLGWGAPALVMNLNVFGGLCGVCWLMSSSSPALFLPSILATFAARYIHMSASFFSRWGRVGVIIIRVVQERAAEVGKGTVSLGLVSGLLSNSAKLRIIKASDPAAGTARSHYYALGCIINQEGGQSIFPYARMMPVS